jgi:hypothetical protein
MINDKKVNTKKMEKHAYIYLIRVRKVSPVRVREEDHR